MAKEIIPDRICPHCGGNEWYKDRNIYKGKKKISYYPRYTCAKKQKERDKQRGKDYREKYPERVALRLAKYYSNNKEVIRKKRKIYFSTENGKKILRKGKQKQRDNLTDNYIRDCIAINVLYYTKEPFDRQSISKKMIKQYRQIKITKRKLKSIKNENQKTT